MGKRILILQVGVVLAIVAGPLNAQYSAKPAVSNAQKDASAKQYGRWPNGPSSSPNYFPIAVWLQSPRNAARFRNAGINLYVGLYRGPTEDQLSELKSAGMQVICSQNAGALKLQNSDVIVGWMHGDEPDNAQRRRDQKGYGPPIPPETIVSSYEQIQSRDLTRPILLNLGQGVAYDQYIGRGVRRNHPEDYAEYLKGCDIASFDIYPAVHESPDVAGKLEFVAKGVDRLRQWSDDKKIVWNCIECSRISNTETKPTPAQIRAEVWMSLIHGSQGLIYFVHQFKPTFKEASLLDDEELLSAVTAINRQVQELAPVLNSATVADAVKIIGGDADTQIATICKRYEGALYVFTVNMHNRPAKAAIELIKPTVSNKAEVLSENRSIDIRDGRFKAEYDTYGVHLFRIGEAKTNGKG